MLGVILLTVVFAKQRLAHFKFSREGLSIGHTHVTLTVKGVFGWYKLEQDRTAGAHGAASCQPNGTPETEHIFL